MPAPYAIHISNATLTLAVTCFHAPGDDQPLDVDSELRLVTPCPCLETINHLASIQNRVLSHYLHGIPTLSLPTRPLPLRRRSDLPMTPPLVLPTPTTAFTT